MRNLIVVAFAAVVLAGCQGAIREYLGTGEAGAVWESKTTALVDEAVAACKIAAKAAKTWPEADAIWDKCIERHVKNAPKSEVGAIIERFRAFRELRRDEDEPVGTPEVGP